MKRILKYIAILMIILGIIIGSILFIINKDYKEEVSTTKVPLYTINGIVKKIDNNYIIIVNDDKIYTINNKDIDANVGNKITINCLYSIDNCEVYDYKINEEMIPNSYLDNGIFKDYYLDSYLKLQEMSIDEKISQMLLAHYQNKLSTEQSKYQLGGVIFFQKDFNNKTKDEVIEMINNLQNKSNIPLLTAVDEEGGLVSRISNNKNLVSNPFKSPQELYNEGGFNKIKEDIINKNKILKELGLNLNLAPVVDVSLNKDDFIYKRTLGQSTDKVAEYAKLVIETSYNSGVSYTLKHFPGYGNNLDTHKGISIDNKSLEEIKNIDLPPFMEGIKSNAEAIMFSHNIVNVFDANNPTSLAASTHKYLRNNLNYTGIIITDDLNMQALNNIDNVEIKAILAGNDLLIVPDYEKSFNNIKNGLLNNLISEEDINRSVFRILAWKYYKNLIS